MLIGSTVRCAEIRQCNSASLQRKKARSLQTIRRVKKKQENPEGNGDVDVTLMSTAYL